MYGDNIPFPRDLRHVLKLAQDYSDGQRLAWVEPAKIILPEQDVEFVDTEFAEGIALFDQPFDIKPGEVYDVMLRSSNPVQEFTIRTEEAVAVESSLMVVFDLMGESFWFGNLPPEEAEALGAKAGISLGEPGTCTVSITKPETIHPIDPKFLPDGVGGGFTVVELETPLILGENAITSEADKAALTKAVETGLPTIIKYAFVLAGHTMHFSEVFTLLREDNAALFSTTNLQIGVGIEFYSGEWVASVADATA